MSRGWAKTSACRLQITLSCAVLCHIVSLQYLSSWSLLSSFLVIFSPSGDAQGPSVVFEAVDMPCPGPFHFSHSVDYIYAFCPLPDPDVGPSIFVCDVEHTSFHFGLCGRKFVLCLFGQCPGLCTICHSWQHTGVITIFASFHVFGMRRSVMHFVYSFASCFAIVSSPAFSVSMLT